VMAGVQKRVIRTGAVRWDVRYRDDARRQRKRSFERKVDATRFARSVETAILLSMSLEISCPPTRKAHFRVTPSHATAVSPGSPPPNDATERR
jgi:hypothetical protein